MLKILFFLFCLFQINVFLHKKVPLPNVTTLKANTGLCSIHYLISLAPVLSATLSIDSCCTTVRYLLIVLSRLSRPSAISYP